LRKEYIAEQAKISEKRLFFLDEAGYRLGSCGIYGWSEVGSEAYGHNTCGSWETISMIGVMNSEEICSFITIDSSATTEVFIAFIDQQLIKHLREGDCIIMDNISVHKNSHVKDLIESTGAIIKFLPPYSPDLNPIEKLWSKTKQQLRRMDTLTRDVFDKSASEALKLVKVDDLRAWIKNAGYQVGS
jgi:transposase